MFNNSHAIIAATMLVALQVPASALADSEPVSCVALPGNTYKCSDGAVIAADGLLAQRPTLQNEYVKVDDTPTLLELTLRYEIEQCHGNYRSTVCNTKPIIDMDFLTTASMRDCQTVAYRMTYRKLKEMGRFGWNSSVTWSCAAIKELPQRARE